MDEEHELEIVDEQPKPPPGVVVASNGAWRDEKTGRFVPGGPVVSTAITKENADSFQQLIAEKKFSGIVAANNGAGRLSPSGMAEDTWADIAEKLAGEAIDGKGIARVQSAQTLGRMTGLLPGGNGRSRDDSPPAAGARLELGPGALDRLLEFISENRE